MLRYPLFSCHPNHVFPELPGLMVLLLLACVAVAPITVRADNAMTLYDVDVLVVDESPAVRLQAFAQGMKEILIRISGDSIVMDKLKPPAPSRYVKQFSYEPVENPSVNAAGEVLNQRLKIQYNGTLLEKYLLDNGFPVWSEHRKELVLWFVIRDGNNEYVLKDSDESVLKSAVNTALTRRGVPARWPLYDAADKKIVSVVDLRGGFQDQVATASKRYSPGPVLTASMRWDGKQWQSSWSLFMKAGDRHWSLADADYVQLINKAIDQAVDAMGVVFAIRRAADNTPMVSIRLNVEAVNSVEKYRRVENYLSGLSAVEFAQVYKVDDARVTFDLTLRSNKEDFFNLIKNDAELIAVENAIPEKRITATTGEAASLSTGVIDRSNGNLSAIQPDQAIVYNYKLTN